MNMTPDIQFLWTSIVYKFKFNFFFSVQNEYLSLLLYCNFHLQTILVAIFNLTIFYLSFKNVDQEADVHYTLN